MGILTWFRRKKYTPTPPSDEDRAASLEIRRINSEIKKTKKNAELEKARLELWKAQNEVDEIRGMYEDDDEEETDMSPDALLNMFMLQMLSKMQPQPQNNQNSQSTPHTQHMGRELSIQEMEQIYESVPKAARKRLKKLDDEQLSAQIHSFVPDISPNSLNNAISFIRSQ